jgi:Trypsin
MVRLLVTFFFSCLLVVSCKTRGFQLLVTDSVQAKSGEEPAVVKLTMVRKKGSNTHCTATYLSDRILLTAAHCLFDREDSFRTYNKFLVNGIEVQEIKPHPDYYPASFKGTDFSNWDVALLLMPPTGIQETKSIDLSLVNQGDQVKFVGFGRTTSDEQGNIKGEKHIGCGYISEVQEKLYLVNGKTPVGVKVGNPDCTSKPGPADSGGPAFRNGKIIGTVSGQFEKDGVELTRLNWPEITEFFKSCNGTEFEIPNLKSSLVTSDQGRVLDDEDQEFKVSHESERVRLEGKAIYFLYYNCESNGRAGEGLWHHTKDGISATFWKSRKLFKGPGLKALDKYPCTAP